MVAGVTAREFLPLLCRDLEYTIAVPVDRPPLDFDLDGREAVAMFDQAHEAALDQLGITTV